MPWCSHPDAPIVLEELERIARLLGADVVVRCSSAAEARALYRLRQEALRDAARKRVEEVGVTTEEEP